METDPLPLSVALSEPSQAPMPEPVQPEQAPAPQPPPEPIKRKRGRPKGSKNRPRLASATAPGVEPPPAGASVAETTDGENGQEIPEGNSEEQSSDPATECGESVVFIHELIGCSLAGKMPSPEGNADPTMSPQEREQMAAVWTAVARKRGWQAVPIEVIAVGVSVGYFRRISADDNVRSRLGSFLGYVVALPQRLYWSAVQWWAGRWATQS